ncbi:phospholipase D/nuclease [Laetiporus sulphureus 93-53]|uniref:Phospholipase D/nuclease n=1 Tax=Laetiporus sulphureus 93-53 TaxID=1314785 RepID=A0A165FHR5_9APHY|nr:phospholipase D/nuclease [Laetiporus sulphureus 93-53]KZT08989.1 phospholipase D/nuclease [Laetiporus sulphureus 93-53]
MYPSEDEDVARAIALSLQESSLPTRGSSPNTYDSKSRDNSVEDEEARFQAELQRAIEASKRDATSSVSSGFATPADNAPSRASTNSSFISERAQLERERLARQKRLRPNLDTDARESISEDESDDDEHRNKSGASTSGGSIAQAATASTRTSFSSASGEQLFWDGELRQTANMLVDPEKDARPTFRLSEILAPRDDIAFAIVSSFVFSFSWLYSLFNPNTPVIAVAQDPEGQKTIKTILPNWVKTTPFLRNGWGCMHMKFMLLFYKSGRLRVVVSTANMVEYDWRDIENSVWLQDFPPRPSPISRDSEAEDFPTALTRVLHAVNVAPALNSHLQNEHPDLPLQRLENLRTRWDFSKAKVQLVPSIAGKHEGWPKVVLAGHTALMKAVRDAGMTADKNTEVVLECQGSSIGTYSTQWMNEFYCSARGESPQSWLDTSKTQRAKLPYPPVKILFPTLQYVRESKLGERGGGTMFCRQNQWEGAKFPRELFHQSRSKRGRVLMHSKHPNARQKQAARSDVDTDDEDANERRSNKFIGWAYVGSHNFTASAWGTLSGSAFSPTLNITNYELGILLPIRKEEEIDRIACWERPPKKYVLGKDEPWMQAESSVYAAMG